MKHTKIAQQKFTTLSM